jgi:DNA-binding GntR family transcriptional regulator
VGIDPGIAEWPYRQVAALIRGRIASGEYARLLPSYVTLAHELNVAPGTVQHAIRVLRAEGLVVTVPGRGTFVAPGAGNAAPV